MYATSATTSAAWANAAIRRHPIEHDGATKWERATTWQDGEQGQKLSYAASAAIANLDNTGRPEIIVANQIIDADGGIPLVLPAPAGQWSATVAADLDSDGDLEVVLGHAAFHHDGTLLWDTGLSAGYPQVADLDDDGLPEIVLTNNDGLSLIEHDGVVTYAGLRPTGNPVGFATWQRPATIHDFDGDGTPEYASSSGNDHTVYEADGSIVWNQHAYHVTNVREDGTIPDFEAPHWESLNTFRTNAQIDGSGVCVPRPPG